MTKMLDILSKHADKTNFYSSGAGDQLFSGANFPQAIREFLQSERLLLASASKHKQAIVEIGCHEGTYAQWSRAAGKRYLGVDPVERYIQQGLSNQPDINNERSKLVVGAAEYIDKIIAQELSGVSPSDILIFIPFNCFGNIVAVESAVRSIAQSGCSLLLSSYDTTSSAILARFAYYYMCGYNPLVLKRSERGALFYNDNGLHTYAYEAAWLIDLFSKFSMIVRAVNYGGIGQAFITLDIDEVPS